ncbi:hypothetical protein Dimus_010277 [Dionaea muscipula]
MTTTLTSFGSYFKIHPVVLWNVYKCSKALWWTSIFLNFVGLSSPLIKSKMNGSLMMDINKIRKKEKQGSISHLCFHPSSPSSSHLYSIEEQEEPEEEEELAWNQRSPSVIIHLLRSSHSGAHVESKNRGIEVVTFILPNPSPLIEQSLGGRTG